MHVFRYEARDRRGLIQKGQITADNLSTARGKLEADGMEIRLLEEVEPAAAQTAEDTPDNQDAPQQTPLSDIDRMPRRAAREVAEHIADLTQSRLPVSDGLRALAMDLSTGLFRRRTLVKSLTTVADRLDSGVPIIEVLEALPASSELSAVMGAGVKNGHAAEAVGDYAAHANVLRGLGWRTFFTVCYPLLAFIFAMGALVYLYVAIIPDVAKLFEDFAIELNGLTLAVLATSRALTATVQSAASVGFIQTLIIIIISGLVVVGLWMGRTQSGRFLVNRIPVLGRIFKWNSVARLCHLLAILIKQNEPLETALRKCGNALLDPDLVTGCYDLASQIESGAPNPRLQRPIEGFPTGFLQLLSANTNRDALSEALHATARMYEARVRVRASVVGFILKPLVLIFGIAIPMLITALGLFLPLWHLLRALA